MKNIIITTIGFIAILFFNACAKNKLQGNLKTTGIVVDAYNQQPIVGAILQMTSCQPAGGLGGFNNSIMGSKDTTDNSGFFEVEGSESRSSQKFIMILNQLANKQILSTMYIVPDWRPAGSSPNSSKQEWMQLQLLQNETLDLKVEMQRLSWLKLNVKQNVNNAIDTLTFSAHRSHTFIVKKDSTYYCPISPNQASRVAFKKNNKEIQQINVTTSLKGDTISHSISL
jgi:hypothetical protein